MSEEPDRQVVFLNVTTTQRDSLTAQTGGVVFNTTTQFMDVLDLVLKNADPDIVEYADVSVQE